MNFMYLITKYDPKIKQYLTVAVTHSFPSAKKFIDGRGGKLSSLAKYPNENTYHIEVVGVI